MAHKLKSPWKFFSHCDWEVGGFLLITIFKANKINQLVLKKNLGDFCRKMGGMKGKFFILGKVNCMTQKESRIIYAGLFVYVQVY
jgi:hypothetical protein